MQKKSTSRWPLLLPVLLVLTGMLLLAMDSPPQQVLRNNLFDQYQRWHPRPYTAVPLRIVDIDDESLAQLGQWPWPRTRIAELIDKLSASGTTVIGFDVLFAEPDRTSPRAAAELWKLQGRLRQDLIELPDHDQVLADTLARSDAVLGFAMERGDSAVQAVPASLVSV